MKIQGNLKNFLERAKSEEELKNFFIKFFDIEANIQKNIDLYTPQILFEFKLSANIQSSEIRAKCFAQTVYYARRLKYSLDGETRALTKFICISATI